MSLLDAYRRLPAWRLAVYIVALLGLVALIVLDIVKQSAQFTTIGALALVVILILVRPGGIDGPRSGPGA